ncbi:3-hydroxyacyl-CoA dehydrogenase family protein [Paenibacillus polysaccharolyticus]|uniref:3-hydroxyacyl-CoA dehydrogenase family protein n=1 Tax=Paenibacillus polysaccharolyticus TaxID=582692 RepID=UPI00203D1118|nr:3-hydroxyacyl-CoA dehydrogenase family protein [Paenibacillus polysaccharolyticus]MCM3133475.1 3-hydroxyacyl-CoA dehydrogenase family protein [Paenibacillus polysaccharolyticus]
MGMKIGVIGAGVMGKGVAQNLAQSGHNVILIDISDAILDQARTELLTNIRFSGFYNKDAGAEDPDTVLSRVMFTTHYDSLGDADFIIENVPEQWQIKKEVYEQLEQYCPESCIYLVNTSCISITKVGAVTKRPDKVIGVHFMNPVPLKPVVEAIQGYHTSERTILETRELLRTMGKEAILVQDLPGFVSNRVSHLLMNEAAFVVQDQVATPEDVDDIFVKCFGHTMGPLRTADLIGLDTVVHSLDVLYETYQDPKYRVCPLLRKMVDAGLLGAKSGQGFFEHVIF